MVITLCYDAISKNVEGLGISPFIVFSISGLSIFPACLIILSLQDRIGRKAMASSSLFLSGVMISIAGFLLKINGRSLEHTSVIILITFSRFGVVIAYNSAAQYATEILPLSVRAQGVAACHVVGYACTFLSSYILYLGHYLNFLPSLILGILAIVGALFCLLLPETLHRNLPLNLYEGERFGENENILYFSCFDRSRKRIASKSQETIVEQF